MEAKNLAAVACVAPGLKANLSAMKLGSFQTKQLFFWPNTKPVCVALESG